MPVDISFDADVSDVIAELLGMLADGSPLSKLLESLGPEAARLIEEALLEGVKDGDSAATIARKINEAFDMPRWRALTIARTEIMRAYRLATLDTYRKNSDVLKGWYWLSTLSTRTCAACWSLNGHFFPLTQTFFPGHVSCRCTCVPALKDSTFAGQSGADAFAELLPAERLKILGPSRYEMYQQGTALADFTMLTRDKDWGGAYQVRPLGQMKKRKAA
jgi:SPP1 gp7 family putative phage head morphogenesis protein